MDNSREEVVEKYKKDNIRSKLYDKIYDRINPLLNNEVGRNILNEDMNRFILLFEKIIESEFDELKIDDFIELKYLRRRIVKTSNMLEKIINIKKND